MNAAQPTVAILAVGIALVAGVYVTAVLDAFLFRAVAGGRRPYQDAFLGPMRAGAVLILQGRSTTERPDAAGWALAPALLVALAALTLALVPLAPGLVAADPDSGFVVFSAAIAFVMIAVFLHGWSPNSMLALHGAYRYGAIALAFQIPFLLAFLATALPAESLSIVRIVEAQEVLWNVVRQPLGLPLYLVVGVAVAVWGPLNLPDARDLASGTSVEDSGVARLLWQFARRAMLLAVAAMGAAGFLGGWHGPLLPGPLWVTVKTLALLLVMLAAGHMLARVRIGRFVVVSWAVLIPLALLNIFVAGAFLL